MWRRRTAQPTLPPNEQLASAVGPLLLPARDQVMRAQIARTGDWEPDEAMLFAGAIAPGTTVVDIGAHVGYYTLLSAAAAGRRGRVIAVEPDPVNAALLRENVRRRRLRTVTVIEAAAWRETTRLALRRDPTASANSADNRIDASGRAADSTEVAAVALDDILASADVRAVKVDAQGADHAALEGMSATLERCKPFVLAEFWPAGIRELGEDPVGVIDGYRALGLRVEMLGVQEVFEFWPAAEFVRIADLHPGGVTTLTLRAA